MSKHERFSQILSLLQKQTFLSVEELSKILYVSPSTLRRDLAEMGRGGYLLRTHGGAAALPIVDASETILHSRAVAFTPTQNAIAARAAELIPEGGLIFLDASQLCLCMAELLKNRKPLTIVTNGLSLISPLSEAKHRVIACSGTLSAQNFLVLDHTTAAIATAFNYQAAFIGCGGISNGHTSTRSLQTAALLNAVVAHAKKTYLLCTRDKVGVTAPVNAVSVKHLSGIITDASVQSLTAAGYNGIIEQPKVTKNPRTQ